VLSAISGHEQAIPGAEVKRNLLEWAQRTLLESSMTKIQYAVSAAK
jgi:hypothetical protein